MRLSASLYAADPLHLAEAVAAVSPHVASLHVDIMDGRFAPAFGLNERHVERLLELDAAPVDVHLMTENPHPWAVRLAAMGVGRIAFHWESAVDVIDTADAIRKNGARAYLALTIDTALAHAVPLARAVDGFLLLTAPAGGGAFSPRAMERVADLPPGFPVIVDGRVDERHFGFLSSCAVELAVVGRTLFATDDVAKRAVELAAACNPP